MIGITLEIGLQDYFKEEMIIIRALLSFYIL